MFAILPSLPGPPDVLNDLIGRYTQYRIIVNEIQAMKLDLSFSDQQKRP